MIRLANVFKEYPRTGMALNDVSFMVAKGEFAFLTGPSGAGKSSILKLIYMDEVPTRGTVWVGGTKSPVSRRSVIAQVRRKLGVVFQDFRLLEDRRIEDNVAFALEVIDTPRERIGPKVSRLLTRVGLASKATNYPRELSGGEQQRVAIARALVNDPFVLIADEPTGNLDDRATRGVFQLLKDINAAGTAVIMATHNLELVRRNEYRVLEINRGQLVFDSAEQAGRAVEPTP
ncbi:MAG TPA: cell division ATP-binding protein FtsE [Gemmatimonadaceae bacterium]|jgi:cell division transport system ATP-binding protein